MEIKALAMATKTTATITTYSNNNNKKFESDAKENHLLTTCFQYI